MGNELLFPDSAMSQDERRKLLNAKHPTRRGARASALPGPAGETCGGCAHAVVKKSGAGNRYWKCGLRKPSAGAGTDIRKKDPACSQFKGKTDDEAR